MPRDPKWEYWLGLNEVQFPKELRLGRDHVLGLALHASMKCSSRKNCDRRITFVNGITDKPQ